MYLHSRSFLGSAALSILYFKDVGLALVLLHLSTKECCGLRHRKQEEGGCPPLFSAKLFVAQTSSEEKEGMKKEHKLWKMCSGEVLGNMGLFEQGDEVGWLCLQAQSVATILWSWCDCQGSN